MIFAAAVAAHVGAALLCSLGASARSTSDTLARVPVVGGHTYDATVGARAFSTRRRQVEVEVEDTEEGLDMSAGACEAECAISVGPQCYPSMAAAIQAAPSGATISIGNGLTLREEVQFTKNLSFVGCAESGRQRVQVDMDSAEGAAFRAMGDNQTVAFSHLSFFGAGKSKYSSLLRTPELGDNEFPNEERTGPVSLIIDDCDFSDFRTLARGGAVIFIGKVGDVSIAHSDFTGNSVAEMSKNRYEGGGAIWLNRLLGNATVSSSTFRNNVHEFGHGTGGAFMVLEMHNYTRLDIVDCVFENNLASSGGAVYIKDINRTCTVNIDSEFTANTCLPSNQFGCRGGALWVQNIGGDLTIKGRYVNNAASIDRGGVIANNRLEYRGRVLIDATFINNTCGLGAAVFDNMYGLHRGGRLTIASSTVFEGNVGEEKKDMIVRLMSDPDPHQATGRNIIRYETQWKASGVNWEFVGGKAWDGSVEH